MFSFPISPVPASSTAGIAVEESAYRAKASEVQLMDQGRAAAIGAGLPITDVCGNFIAAIRGGTTASAMVSLAGRRLQQMGAGGGQRDSYHHSVRQAEHDLLIGERTAERTKMKLGSFQ